MERHVVIGTAGHIDHGKTTLVKSLTGVDTDRLSEEKARGITIDLGFAPLELDGVHAGVVDVPGHEGFIRNMVAGATGVDLALLVVAADEGVMPQTREHVTILKHLGVTRGVVALTKVDIAPDADWRALVAEDIRSLIKAEIGADWPVLEVSAQSGAGLDELRAELSRAAKVVDHRESDDLFRMPVDRVFALAGAGTIVTGTVWSGVVRAGDTVRVLPAGVEGRVRTIQVHGADATEAGSGRRTALALVGVERAQAPRGAVVVGGAAWRVTRELDTAITMSGGVPLKPRMQLRVHHGTADVMGRVSRLGESRDGVTAVRIALEEPLVARAGDRLVLRSLSPVATIGGGFVTDPWAERQLDRERRVRPRFPAADDAGALEAILARQGAAGLMRAELEVASGFDAPRFAAALPDLKSRGVVERDGWLVDEREVERSAQAMMKELAAFHKDQPLEPGMNAQAWRSAARVKEPRLVELAEQLLLGKGMVEREGSLVRQPAWQAGTSREARDAAEKLLEKLRQADAEPPTPQELLKGTGWTNVPAVLRLLERAGEVVQVADRYYETGALAREKERLVAALKELGPATPAQLRDRLGRSRKFLIPLLEWADREGLTVREGDKRMLRIGMGA